MARPQLTTLAGIATVLAATAPVPAAPPPDAELRRMLVTRVDVQHQATGIVIGIVAPGGRHVVAYGMRGLDDKRPVTADTVFDIGSITKLFTALLLADLATRGQVALDDPVARYLPDSVHVPERNARRITLVDLVTHTSGLPLRPTNLVSNDPDNKYAGYTTDLLYQFLAGFPLPRDPGSEYEYSNVGYGLLGQALSRKLSQGFADAVQARITGPLGMLDTRIVPTRAMQAREAVGYSSELAPAPHWDLGALESAAALHSTAHDLMRLLEAQLGYRKTALGRALSAMLVTRRPGGMAPSQFIAMGWNIQVSGGREIAWKNGSVGGYRTFIGFDAKARIGVVALANAQTAVGADDIGLHVLDPSIPVDLHLPVAHKAIALEPAVLDRYVGRYKFSDTDILIVTRDGAQLHGKSPGADKYPLYPEAEREFFLKLIDAQITFVVPPDGPTRASAAIWHQGGQDQRGERIE
jgi:D-alanyl-D-alanine-carboxypeptidase/D-alanyl-D-alanine-endopeptidase